MVDSDASGVAGVGTVVAFESTKQYRLLKSGPR